MVTRSIFSARGVVLLFLVCTFFVVLCGIFLQLYLIPRSPWHAGNGLLSGGDWVTFHSLAVDHAAQIRSDGWTSWELRIAGQFPASVAAALYVVTGIDQPYTLLPIHGVLFAMAVFVLFRLMRGLGATQRQCLLALLPFFAFPSAAMIWGQIHKDIYSLTGFFMVMSFWVRAVVFLSSGTHTVSGRGIFLDFFFLAIGTVLIAAARPYLGELVFILCLVLALALLLIGIFQIIYLKVGLGKFRVSFWHPFRVSVFALVGVLVQFASLNFEDAFFKYAAPAAPAPAAPAPAAGVVLSSEVNGLASATCPLWRPSVSIPDFVDDRFAAIACARYGFTSGYPDAGSNIDTEVNFETAADIFFYIPRALQILLFSPFPNSWFDDAAQPAGRIMRAIAAIEMLYLYSAFLGLVFALRSPRLRWATLTIIFLSVSLVLAYSLVVSNVGTLYRMRYPAMLIWIAFGSLGLFEFLNARRGHAR